MIERMEPKVLLLTGTIIISYFLWMDIAVYYQTQARDKPYLVKSKDSSPWSPFQHVTLKLLMSDHANHYVYVPTAEMFDEVTHFTSIFSFVTANMVTWSHMIVSLISARFFISESLCMRRIGVILYEFRTWLDALDGVVARARLHEKHNFVSRHGTSGYFADAVADIVSGFALVISLYIFLLRTLPKKLGVQFTNSLPFTNKSHSPEGDLSFAPTLTKRGLFLKMLLFGILLAVSSNLWDNFIWQYQEVIEVSTSPPDQQVTISADNNIATIHFMCGAHYIATSHLPLIWFQSK